MDNEASKAPIPRFTSFKPKPVPTVTGDVPRISKSSRTHGSKRKHDQHHDRHHGRRDTKRRDGLEHQSRERIEVAQHAAHGNDSLYTVDKKGDANNLTYQRLHKYHVPQYRRTGYGSVVGLISKYKIQRESNDDALGLIISNDARATKKARELSNKRFRFPPESTLRVSRKDTHDLNQAFIPLRTAQNKRKRDDAENGQDLMVSSWNIGNPNRNEPDTDEDEEAREESESSDADDAEDQTTDWVKLRNKELLERTRLEPTNVRAWLDLAQHQHAMCQMETERHTLSVAERRNLAEIRISIYKEAVKAVGKDTGRRECLVLRLLAEGARVWESQRLRSKWHDAINEYRDSLAIRQRFLDFSRKDFAEFRYETCREAFMTLLASLQSLPDGKSAAQSDLLRRERLQMRTVLRLTLLMRDSGYEELAIATWQALLEFHLFRPQLSVAEAGNNENHQTKAISMFEEFWDSEVPRIGEVNASGWASYHNHESCRPPAPSTGDAATPINRDTCFRDFYDAERSLEIEQRWPGRTVDEAREDDPYHLVLFSDLVPLLSALPHHLHEVLLINAFVTFAGFPGLASQTQNNRNTADGNMFENSLISPLESEPVPQNFAGALARISELPLKNYIMTSEDLFGKAFDVSRRDSPYLGMVRLVLGSVASLPTTSESVLEYHLAFEHTFYPQSAGKVAKACIKRRSSSLRLYNAYALMNKANPKVFERIISSALGLAHTLPAFEQRNSIILWHTWVWNTLRNGADTRALELLLAIPNGSVPDPATLPKNSTAPAPVDASRLLRLQHYLAALYDSALSLSEPLFSHAIVIIELQALTTYLTSNRSLPSAIATFHSAGFTSFQTRGLTHSNTEELLYQTYARFLAFHVSTSRQFKPSILRDELVPGIRRYPSNTVLLSVYAANEARFRIDDRVRSIINDVVLQRDEPDQQQPALSGGDGAEEEEQRQDAVFGHAFAIWTEMLRARASGGTVHAVRAAFEAALADHSESSHSVSLWTSYVHFEHRNRSSDAGLAADADAKRHKEVYLRGLTKLPSCKRYAMLAFGPMLKGVLAWSEMRQIYDLLGEKELRVRVDIEKMLEEIDEAREEGQRVILEGESIG